MSPVSMKSVCVPFASEGGAASVGILMLPATLSSAVLIVQDSSSEGPAHILVARRFHDDDIGTLLVGPAMEGEEPAHKTRPDIGVCARRIVCAIDWLRRWPDLAGAPIGLLGSGAEGAPALAAAAMLGSRVPAVVCCSGRPDLAASILPEIHSASLLIVGSEDEEGVDANRQAYERLNPPKHMAIVSGAIHPAEERASLDEVAMLAGEWFRRHLKPAAGPS